jgi:hypothetical protein
MAVVVWLLAKDDRGLEILDRLEQELGQLLITQGQMREYMLSAEAAEGLPYDLDEIDPSWSLHLNQLTAFD